jgi:hypothetical protein
MELSRSIRLMTSLSPGGGERMAQHSVPAGDIGALLARFSGIRQKALTRTERSFPIDIVEHCRDAWNKLVEQPWRIMSVGLRDWARGF